MDIIAFLHDRYKYDPNTGIFTYARDVWRAQKRGERADYSYGRGYRAVTGPQARGILAHRAAWAMINGAFPDGPLDHINMVRNDNRITNLRPTTPSLNAFHSKIRSTNTSGFRGVSWNQQAGKWQAFICVDNKNKYLGKFPTKVEAAVAYAQAAQLYYNTSADVVAIALSDSPLDGHR